MTVVIVKPEVVDEICATTILEDGSLDTDWIMVKPSGIPCPHLERKDGIFHCTIHNKEWYYLTPCWEYTQIESSKNTPCRMGAYFLQGKNRDLYKNRVLDYFGE